jgi:Family of unknown function (DUF6884)
MATQADRIRQFVLNHYVTPARGKGHSTVTIRAGDVHRAMRLASAMPAVCSAIGSNKFEEFAGVSAIERTGPAQGANVYFRFSLQAPRSQAPPETSRQEPSFGQRTIERIKRIFKTKLNSQVTDEKSIAVPSPAVNRAEQIDLANAIVLVSCVKSKLPHPAPARSLYTSTWFRKTRDLVEASGARWFVLSALYGLVAPDAEIAPYDYTLNTLGVAARRDWATNPDYA